MFISREAQEQIENLQAKVKKLEVENAHLSSQISNSNNQSTSKSRTWKWLFFTTFTAFILTIFLLLKAPSQKNESAWQLNNGGEVSDWHPDPEDSIIYRIQIGAYRDFGFGEVADGGDLLKQESQNEWNKISLGGFSTFKDAQIFHEKAVELGFENAFITAWQGNVQVGLIQKKQ